MASWLHELGLYIYAVLAHWQALATGGFVTAVVSVIEKRRNKSLSWESYATIMAVFVLYSFFAAWQDEHRNTGSVISDKSVLSAQLGSCQGTVQSTQSRLREKETIADAFQKAFVAMQGPQAQQQANIGSCITNLAKMNPVIREKVSVIPVSFGTITLNGRVNDTKGLVMAYLSELFIITNEPERIFNGDLKCTKDFTFVNPPDINPRETVSMLMKTSTQPKLVAPNEYMITVDATGTEWNPSHPAFMTIRTTEKDFGCTFSPQE